LTPLPTWNLMGRLPYMLFNFHFYPMWDLNLHLNLNHLSELSAFHNGTLPLNHEYSSQPVVHLNGTHLSETPIKKTFDIKTILYLYEATIKIKYREPHSWIWMYHIFSFLSEVLILSIFLFLFSKFSCCVQSFFNLYIL